MKRKDRRHSPLKSALAVLVYLAEHRFGATVEELMEETGFKRRNLYRYLAALNEAGVQIKNTSGRGPGMLARFRLVDRPRFGRLIGIS